MTKTELANQEEARQELALANEEKASLIEDASMPSYYSLVPETKEEKIMVYNAINNPDARIGDMIGKTIDVKHILIETVELIDDKTGAVERVPRTVYIDSKNKSYVAVSFGIFNSTKRIVKLFGQPDTWESTVKVEVQQIIKGQNRILTLSIVG